MVFNTIKAVFENIDKRAVRVLVLIWQTIFDSKIVKDFIDLTYALSRGNQMLKALTFSGVMITFTGN